jgi:hypothetical protein
MSVSALVIWPAAKQATLLTGIPLLHSGISARSVLPH